MVVLGVIMVITIVALAYISRSDGELQYGQNMLLRTKADFLAESALEHARGLILNPQEVSGEYWTGATSQQIDSGDFYYDVSVEPNAAYSGPTRWCNYDISCQAYRLSGGERTAQSNFEVLLRLNPCIAYYSGTTLDSQIGSNTLIFGDVYCAGNLTALSFISGDVFCNNYSGTLPEGQHMQPEELSLEWPRIEANDFTSNYTVETISSSLISSQVLEPYNPVRVYHRAGDLEIAGDVEINGMLIVEGDLQISGVGNLIRAGKALPALLVTGNLRIQKDAGLDIEGLAVVDGKVSINVGSMFLNVTGGVFAANGIFETTEDCSGNGSDGVIYGQPIWRTAGGHSSGSGAAELDGLDDNIVEPNGGAYLNGLSAATVTCWVKSHVTNQDRGIFYTKIPTGVDEALGLRYDKTGSAAVQCITASLQTNLGQTQIQSSSNRQDLNWQHLALVWSSGNGLKLYINGVEDTLSYPGDALGGTITGVEKFMLGCGATGQYWDGLMDDVRIYSRALDANDIVAVMGGAESIVGRKTHWKLDESPMCFVTIAAAPAKTAVWCWSDSGQRRKWAQASGSFYKVIRRN